MEKTFQIEDLDVVPSKLKERTKTAEYYCNCKNEKNNLTMHRTDVDSDGICVDCGYYAMSTRNPNGIGFDGSYFGKLDTSCDDRLKQIRKKTKEEVQQKKKEKPKVVDKPADGIEKRIYCKQTRTVYQSIGDAAKKLGLERSSVGKVVNGSLNHTKGYTFRRVGWKD